MEKQHGDKDNMAKSKNKFPSFCQNLKYYLNKYSECSTIHGVRFIGEFKRTKTERFFWIVILLISLYFCVYMIIETYEKWKNSPVIVSFASSPIPISTIPFPSITICPETKTKKHIFNYTNVYNTNQLYNNLTKIEKDHLEKMSLICETNKRLKGSEYVSSDAIDFLDMVAPSLKDVFLKCEWLSVEVPCEEIFTSMLTEDGICYSFNMLNRDELFTSGTVFYNKNFLSHGIKSTSWSLENGYPENLGKNTYPQRAVAAGQKASLSLTLTDHDYNLDYNCGGPVQGYKINLHNPAEYPLIEQQYFRAPLNQEVLVAVRPNMMTTSDGLKDYDPHRRQCYFPYDRQLKYFKVYTQQNCQIECLSNYTLKTCECVAFYMPHEKNDKMCGNRKIQCMRDAVSLSFQEEAKYELGDEKHDSHMLDGCDCLPSCSSLTYNSETSQADYNWRKVYESYNKSLDESSDILLTKMTIFFKEQQFINSERNELYGPVDFFANCGGLLGLFMGFSVLSIIEWIYFLSLRIICNIRKYGRHFWSGSTVLINKYNHNNNNKCS